MFAFLRGEFIHILDWNIHSKFANHLFLPNRTDDLPYDTKYTSQRGLMEKTLTLLYEKKNLITYTMRMDPNAFLQYFSPATFHAIIGCSIFPWKDNFFLPKILEKILTEMADDLNTKTYLKEILTGKRIRFFLTRSMRETLCSPHSVDLQSAGRQDLQPKVSISVSIDHGDGSSDR